MKEIKTDEEFTLKLEEELFIFIGKSKSCVVCDPMHQSLERLLEEYKLKGYYGYIDKLPLTRGIYTIFSAPTIMIFYKGKEILREAGFIEFNNVRKILKQCGNNGE